MPIAPTYPGVYIEEIPSGVRTITGVATSITAFVGYTQRGSVDTPVHIFSFADFERGFGGVTVDSPLSHTVKHFFQNGGTEGYVVRVAAGAEKASTTLRDSLASAPGGEVLTIKAASQGTWGNYVRIGINYDTANPASLFNIAVTELVPRNGDLVVGRTEAFGNLSMDSQHPSFVESVINSRSELITAERSAAVAFTGSGTSISGALTDDDVKDLTPRYRLAYTLNGRGPFEISITNPTPPAADTFAARLAAVSHDIDLAIDGISAVPSANRLAFQTDDTGEQSSIHFLKASRDSATTKLKLGTANGGTETDSAAAVRPAPSGTVRDGRGVLTGGAVTAAFTIDDGDQLNYELNRDPGKLTLAPGGGPLTTLAAVQNWLQDKIPNLEVVVDNNRLVFTATSDDPTQLASIRFQAGADLAKSIATKLKLLPADAVEKPHGGKFKVTIRRGTDVIQDRVDVAALVGAAPPTTLFDLATQWQRQLDDAGKDKAKALLGGATVKTVDGVIQIVPGGADPNISFEFFDGDDTAAAIDQSRNLAAYAPGAGVTALGQVAGLAGDNGSPPGPTELSGSQASKTGIYALEDVDLFNILVMPDATAGAGMLSTLGEAISYCEDRRAFMILDIPENYREFDQASKWIAGSEAASLRSTYAAMYYPRLRMPNPFNPSVVTTYAAAGALAGLYARTDADRGVWKAPAGTAATIEGAIGLSVKLTDQQNGTLNQVGLNCLREFPVYGSVSWGARTGNGADAMADEYKYIPVRRLALYLEESLYRGTQWVVFEPNDEPLWAQIRLNLGAFMHVLFAQGAFKGRTPREAYFVKCDKETTTQNDIDLGRVNIVVGFAPLKPAEFVIIQIQQIAGAILT